jgi:hypothetical protein
LLNLLRRKRSRSSRNLSFRSSTQGRSAEQAQCTTLTESGQRTKVDENGIHWVASSKKKAALYSQNGKTMAENLSQNIPGKEKAPPKRGLSCQKRSANDSDGAG